MNNPVLVTGGTGFLGQALVHELVGQGRSVHILCRQSSDREGLDGLDVQWHSGDLTHPASVHAAARAVAECAGTLAQGGPARAELVHAAALISYQARDAALQRQVNVEGTRTVLAAACRYGFGRVVHVSSVVTVGHAQHDQALDEDAHFNAGDLGVDYVDTKREAEQLALEVRGDTEVIVVNPGVVFGRSRRPSNTARFMQSIWRGRGAPLAPPGGVSVVGVEDVARGIRLALEHGVPGRRYILAESFLPAIDLFQKVARAFEVPGVRAAVPRRLWPAVVAGGRLVGSVRPVKLATPQALKLLGLQFRFTGQRARSELGWEPQPFDRVLWDVAQHMRAAEV
ncbi:MAG: dihydroflavonol-4-reductase [Chlamydiales bacterium]|jgi:dihydroflavonol-4-reductase